MRSWSAPWCAFDCRAVEEEVRHPSPRDPVGRALLGRRMGDTVTVYVRDRMVTVQILGIELPK
jgi:transcription elongation GreA/GreB family factor